MYELVLFIGEINLVLSLEKLKISIGTIFGLIVKT